MARIRGARKFALIAYADVSTRRYMMTKTRHSILPSHASLGSHKCQRQDQSAGRLINHPPIPYNNLSRDRLERLKWITRQLYQDQSILQKSFASPFNVSDSARHTPISSLSLASASSSLLRATIRHYTTSHARYRHDCTDGAIWPFRPTRLPSHVYGRSYRSNTTLSSALTLSSRFKSYSTDAGTSNNSKGSCATQTQIPQVLLSRACALREEHDHLQSRLLTSYDAELAKRQGSLAGVARALADWESANKSIVDLENMIQDAHSDAELRDLASEELNSTMASLGSLASTLQQSLVPPHRFGELPCLIEFRPGAGGDEAALFAGDILRMYRAFCARHRIPCKLIHLESASRGTEEQIQEAVLEIDQSHAYDMFRSEAGVHRVQRVPATETKGRTHTSAVSVLVLPHFDAGTSHNSSGGSDSGSPEHDSKDFDSPESDYYVNPSDVRTDVMRARGAGGQHVNTTDSAVRLTHIPTNTVVAVQESRSQLQNRAKAWTILRSRLAQAKQTARDEEAAALRVSIVGVGRTNRGDKVRTYNWAQSRVTDHRSGMTLNRLDDVLDGGVSLDAIMTSVKGWLGSRDLENLMADEQAEKSAGGKGTGKDNGEDKEKRLQ